MDMLFGTFPSKSLLIIRVALGIIFFAHGAQKVFGWFGGPGLKGVIGYFRQALGVPAPLSVLAAFTELLGGIAMAAFGSGPIKGFGITLIIGILSSMYTAVSVSRGIATLMYGHRRKLTKIAI